MGLELPGELTEPLGWIGLSWPAADEDKLFDAAQQWFSFGHALSPVIDNANLAVESVWPGVGGVEDDALNAFRKWWSDADGPTKRLSDDTAAAEILGGALAVFAGITLAFKLGFVARLISLIVKVAQAIQSAFATFGATLAEVPGWIALTRGACKVLIDRVIAHVQTVIKDLLQKARDLFKKVASKDELTFLAHDEVVLSRLQRAYVGENDPDNPLRMFGRKVVHYMDDAERAQYKLAVKDGKLMDATGQPFDTALGTSFSGQTGRAIYTMDKDQNLYASVYQERGVIHHSSFVAGEPVVGAGELVVEDGTLKVISLRSGHYLPTYGQQDHVLHTLHKQGVDISQVIREGPEDL